MAWEYYKHDFCYYHNFHFSLNRDSTNHNNNTSKSNIILPLKNATLFVLKSNPNYYFLSPQFPLKIH